MRPANALHLILYTHSDGTNLDLPVIAQFARVAYDMWVRYYFGDSRPDFLTDKIAAGDSKSLADLRIFKLHVDLTRPGPLAWYSKNFKPVAHVKLRP